MANMSDAELVKIAQAAVPEHLKTLGRVIVRHDGAPAKALGMAMGAAHEDIAQAVADEVGAKPKKAEPNSADVEFVEHTPLGGRSTVVHVRNGKVARVMKRA